MGECADMVLDGYLNQDGSYGEDENPKQNVNIKRKAPEYGVFNWLMLRHIGKSVITEKKAEQIIRRFSYEVLNDSPQELNTIIICDHISKNFNQFKQWFNNNKKLL